MPPSLPTRRLVGGREAGEVVVPGLGESLAVVARQVGDDLPFARREIEQLGVADQVVGVLVVPVVADEVADIVQQGRRLQHLPGAVRRAAGSAAQRGEDRQGQLAHLLAMLFVTVAGAGKLLDR